MTPHLHGRPTAHTLQVMPTPDKRYLPGFMSARSRTLGPAMLRQILAWHDDGYVFRTDELADSANLERGSKDRHFATQLLRRLAQLGVLENTSTKRKYKEWRVTNRDRLLSLLETGDVDDPPEPDTNPYPDIFRRVAELIDAGEEMPPLEAIDFIERVRRFEQVRWGLHAPPPAAGGGA